MPRLITGVFLLLTTVCLVLLAPRLSVAPGWAASKRECKQQCRAAISACRDQAEKFAPGFAKTFRRTCEKLVLRACRKGDLGVCDAAATLVCAQPPASAFGRTPRTGAVSKRECRQQCPAAIAACESEVGQFAPGFATKFRRTCKKTVLKACRKRGLGVCDDGAALACAQPPGPTTSTVSPPTSTTITITPVSTTSTTTTTTLREDSGDGTATCDNGVTDPGETCPLLEGPDESAAFDATTNYEGDPAVGRDEIEADMGVVRTRVEVEFAPDATVGQVNAVLTRLGGDIVMMLGNVPLLEVRIPDPGSLAALDALIAAANTDPSVRVGRGFLTDIDVLPPNFPSDATADLTKIDNHLAVRGSAAWNARGAIDTLPLVVVGDAFGDGAPNGDTAVLSFDASDFGILLPEDHGYHVLGIIAARFGGAGPCKTGTLAAPTLRGCATGMLPLAAPLRVPLRAADVKAILTSLASRMALVLRAVGIGNVVTNTSLNHCFSGMCGDLMRAGEQARQWALMVRGAGLEGRMLHLTSAGNIKAATPAVTDARTNSSFSAAALHPAIPDFAGTGTIPNLTNTLVIENVVNGAAPTFTPRCLSRTSKRGSPHSQVLSGIGHAVWSLIDPDTHSDDLNGTSMSTPQVTGLAAYLWAIDPTMTVVELRDLLRLTATPVTVGSNAVPCDSASTPPAPIIDAYAAVLALDEATLPTPTSAPVRHAIFDVDDDGDFDSDDLFELSVKLIDDATNALREPAAPSFDRWDLNGDGYTGGAERRMPLDLDRVGSTQYGASSLSVVTQNIEGVDVAFDETTLTDGEILCYYAYSDLYEGNAPDRITFVGKFCGRVVMTVGFPIEITPGLPETLTVIVGRESSTGSELLEDVYIELTPTGGMAVPPSGVTDAQGEFTSQVSLDADTMEVEISVRALDGPGGAVLAEDVVSAVSTMQPLDPRCALELEVGANPEIVSVSGPLMSESTQGPVGFSGSVDYGRAQLETQYDIELAPWVYNGGALARWQRPSRPARRTSRRTWPTL